LKNVLVNFLTLKQKGFDMVTIIKKGAGKKEIQKIIENLNGKKNFDAHKYCGKIILELSPIEIQKSLRDEWE
jgi:molybdate-binding protein